MDYSLRPFKLLDTDCENIERHLKNSLNLYGFEASPFLIRHYNDIVQPIFKFSYNPDNIAYIIISTPKMFEKTFIPFIKNNELDSLQDPLDECMIKFFQKIKNEFTFWNPEVIHDFELLPNRRPKALLQTAAHISGIAYYYQRSTVTNGPWNSNEKINGVCIHPEYGGWFAIRAIIIFKNATYPALLKKEPMDVIPENDKRIKLLEQFNYFWQNGSFRDIIETKERYSTLQIKYFNTKPKDRFKFLKEILHAETVRKKNIIES